MSYGFLINVYDVGELQEDGTMKIVPAIYKGESHYDPPFMPPFHYGDHPENKTGLKSLVPYDVLIFHTTLAYRGTKNRYVIGGFYVSAKKQVGNLDAQELIDYAENPHVQSNDLTATIYKCRELFFDPRDFYLKPPLLFSKELADMLGLNIKWKTKHTPYQQIAWATRAVRKISHRKLQQLFMHWRQHG